MVGHPFRTSEFATYLEDAVIEAELLHHAAMGPVDPNEVERCFLRREYRGNVPAARIRAHAKGLEEEGLLRRDGHGHVEATARGRKQLENVLPLVSGFVQEIRQHYALPGGD